MISLEKPIILDTSQIATFIARSAGDQREMSNSWRIPLHFGELRKRQILNRAPSDFRLILQKASSAISDRQPFPAQYLHFLKQIAVFGAINIGLILTPSTIMLY